MISLEGFVFNLDLTEVVTDSKYRSDTVYQIVQECQNEKELRCVCGVTRGRCFEWVGFYILRKTVVKKKSHKETHPSERLRER